MRKTIETTSATVELAIEQGLLELNTSIEKVEVEVLSKGGLFQKAAIKMTMIETPSDVACEFVNQTLSKMNLNATATAEEKNDCVYITISGEDSAAAIGYRGEALDALQYLTLTVLNNGERSRFKKVVLNAENYREKREETLTALANRLAERALQSCKKIALEPMNPYERRIIHATLQNSEIAETTSEGDEPNRFVVIIPKGVEILGTIDTKREMSRDNRSSGNRDNRSGGSRENRGSGSRDNRSGANRARSNFGDSGNFGSKDTRPNSGRSGSYSKSDDNRVRRERPERADRAPRDSYEDFDHIESKPQEFAPVNEVELEPVKKVGAPKFKSFGGKKRFPF